MSLTRTWLPVLSLAALALSACRPNELPIQPPEPNNATSLRAFQTCDDLEDYVEEAILETLVRNAGGYWDIFAVDDMAEASPGGDSDGPTDYTGTNNQEEGVDEVDIVKTNGTHIFSVEDGKLFITKSWPIADTALLSSVDVGGHTRGLFLEGDTVVVISQIWNGENSDTDFTSRSWSSTRLTFIDVSDPAGPAITREVDVEGYLADGRLINGKGYFAINTYMPIPQEFWDLVWNEDIDLPEFDWEDTEEERDAKRDLAREILRPHVAALTVTMDRSDFLPLYRDQEMNRALAPIEPLHDCHDLYRPADISQYSVLNIVEIDIAGEGGIETTGLLSDGWQVYASQDNLYVSQTSWWSWWGYGDLELSTNIHQFSLTDTGPRYSGSGQVDGWLNDQFSFSEYDGHLRVATTDMDWWWGVEVDDEEPANNIFVLENQDGNLNTVGEVRGIAPGERIFASRMMGEKGYLVTFRQTDPLFTIDLSDPTDPTVVGELELPGFSSYLHPMGDDHLLAVGMAGEEDGTITGLAVNIFDVSDFANPTLAHQWILESDDWSWSEALWDHHAFTYHRGVLTFPAYTWTNNGGDWSYFSGVVVLDASPEGITELGRIDHRDLVEDSQCLYGANCEQEYYSYAWMRRTVYIEDNVFSLSNYGIKVNDLNAPDTEHANVVYQPL